MNEELKAIEARDAILVDDWVLHFTYQRGRADIRQAYIDRRTLLRLLREAQGEIEKLNAGWNTCEQLRREYADRTHAASLAQTAPKGIIMY